MKIILKTLFVFLFFIFLQGINPQISLQDEMSHTNYLQNSSQKVFLVSETMRSAEICITQSSDGTNSSGGRTYAVAAEQFAKTSNTKVRPFKNGDFIHNLSTNLSTEIIIRAP